MSLTPALTLDDLDTTRSSPTGRQIDHAWDFKHSVNFAKLDDCVTAKYVDDKLDRTELIRGKESYSDGTHLFEIHWPCRCGMRDRCAMVGVATALQTRSFEGHTNLVGNSSESWGLNIHSGTLIHDGVEVGPYNSVIQFHDTFRILLEADKGTLSFIVDGTNLGVAFNNLPHTPIRPLYIAASTTQNDCEIRMRYLGAGDAILPVEHICRLIPQFSGDGHYRFHERCGSNVKIVNSGTTVLKITAKKINNAVTLTNKPLVPGKVFEIVLDAKTDTWHGGIRIGLTTNSPENFQFPAYMADCAEGLTYLWCGKQIFKNGNAIGNFEVDLGNCKADDRVGIGITDDSYVLFWFNGQLLRCCLVDLIGRNCQMYGVVDFSGSVEKVSIAEMNTSGSTGLISEDITLKCMRNTVINIDRCNHTYMVEELLTEMETNLLMPFQKTENENVRQMYGDFLADLGVAEAFANLLHLLHTGKIHLQVAIRGMDVVTNICLHCTSVSQRMCRHIRESSLSDLLSAEFKRCERRGKSLVGILRNIGLHDFCTDGPYAREETEAGSQFETSRMDIHQHFNIVSGYYVQVGNNCSMTIIENIDA
ncbi:uncharacterized protein [Ptychodera flava]|uniref:uncharacterized protein n=1 Tax=Ptychodera flava TaxID=63121 RepID=UPI00396A57DF